MAHVEDPAVREHYEQTNVERKGWLTREVIAGGGGGGCPIFHRWEILKLWGWKLMVHHFLPYAEDIDHHDHPASFLTVVLTGRYWDESPCGCGDGCPNCGGTGVLWEELSAPTVRWRRGEHQHRTLTTSEGAWTVVLMMPKRRAWGMLRDRRWMPWDEYVKRHGAAIKCDDDTTGVRP